MSGIDKGKMKGENSGMERAACMKNWKPERVRYFERKEQYPWEGWGT